MEASKTVQRLRVVDGDGVATLHIRQGGFGEFGLEGEDGGGFGSGLVG